MAAVWASQADRRAEEKADADALRAKSRTLPATPNVVTDGSDTALRLAKDAVAQAAADRAAADKAAEARKAEAERRSKPDPFAPEEVDSFRPADEPSPARSSDPFAPVDSAPEPKPAPGFLSYQTASMAQPAASGSALDTRY